MPFDKQKENFDKLVVERTEKMEKLQKSFNFENLIYIILKVPLKYRFK